MAPCWDGQGTQQAFADPVPGGRPRRRAAQSGDRAVPAGAALPRYEIKWDGYRLHVHVEPSGVRVVTRGGHDWTHRFPAIAAAAAGLGAGTVILDGEAVVLDEQGRSDYPALLRVLGGRGGKRIASEAMFYAFDLLYLDGVDLRPGTLDDRRAALATLLDGADPHGWIRLSEEIDGDGGALLRHACSHGLEGIIAKDRRKPYRSGRGTDWLKIKCIESEGFLIIGYEPSPVARGGLGRLLLACRDGGALAYAGSVGTGFTDAMARSLRQDLDASRCEMPVIPLRDKRIVWVDPVLVAEIAFRGWTGDGVLRHASYKGLRAGADAAGIFTRAPAE